MDGNNRWSIKNKRSKYDSYKNGAKKLEITKFIFDNYDINYVSAFALSKHNFKRGSSIISIIEKVLNDFLTHNLNKNNFNFRFSFRGDLTFLPKKIFKGIKDLEKINIKSKKQLIIYLNYSGKEDIISAAKSLKKINKINEITYRKNLKSLIYLTPIC